MLKYAPFPIFLFRTGAVRNLSTANGKDVRSDVSAYVRVSSFPPERRRHHNGINEPERRKGPDADPFGSAAPQ